MNWQSHNDSILRLCPLWIEPWCCVKSLQSEGKLPKPLNQWGRSHQAKLILLAFVPLEWGQSPWATLQKNLKETWRHNMSVDCGFAVSDAPIYASSWNLRNNLTLRLACSIELNALSEEKLIGRLIGCACDGVIAVVVPITRWGFNNSSGSPKWVMTHKGFAGIVRAQASLFMLMS